MQSWTANILDWVVGASESRVTLQGKMMGEHGKRERRGPRNAVIVPRLREILDGRGGWRRGEGEVGLLYLLPVLLGSVVAAGCRTAPLAGFHITYIQRDWRTADGLGSQADGRAGGPVRNASIMATCLKGPITAATDR